MADLEKPSRGRRLARLTLDARRMWSGRTTVNRNQHPHRSGDVTCLTALSSFRLYRVSAFVCNSICLCHALSAKSPRLAYATVGMRRSHRNQSDMLYTGIAGKRYVLVLLLSSTWPVRSKGKVRQKERLKIFRPARSPLTPRVDQTAISH